MKLRSNNVFISVLAAIVFILIVVRLYWIVSTDYLAEYGLHATCIASMAVEEFVLEHGRWPASWKELESVSADIDNVYSWPRDSDEIKRYVDIDFEVTLREIADQDLDNFNAIKPRVPAYQGYRKHYSRLLDTVRNVDRPW